MKKWKIDPTHSEIGFRVKHMMFTNVNGKFENYDADITFDENAFENASLKFSAAIQSINTNNSERDNHLKSADFFDAEQFPQLTFESTSIEPTDGAYEVKGNLTMHGVTKPVTLQTEYSGVMRDPWGNNKVGLQITGKINRKDFGLNYNAALETGGVLIGEQVHVNIEIQLAES